MYTEENIKRITTFQGEFEIESAIKRTDCFKLCALHGYKWLRETLEQGSDRPFLSLCYPEPEDYAAADVSDFRSDFLFGKNMVINLVVREVNGILHWYLKTLEPMAVPDSSGDENGRFTERKLHLQGNRKKLLCRYVETAILPLKEEYSLSSTFPEILTRILDDEHIAGFKGDSPYHGQLGYIADYKHLHLLTKLIKLEERQQPLVLLCTEEQPFANPFKAPQKTLKTLEEIKLAASGGNSLGYSSHQCAGSIAAGDMVYRQRLMCEIMDMAQALRGKAGIIMLGLPALDAKSVIKDFSAPGITIYEPVSQGGKVHNYPMRSLTRCDVKGIKTFLESYPIGRTLLSDAPCFEHFLTMSYMCEIEDLEDELDYELGIEHTASAESVLHSEADETAALKEQVRSLQQKCVKLSSHNESLKEKLQTGKNKSENRSEAADYEAQISTLMKKLAAKDAEISRLKRPEKRPEDAKAVADWALREFSGKLVLTKKASEMLGSLKPGELSDIGLLCDCLEFLATDFRDKALGSITAEEMNKRCAEKYGRPFEVRKLGDMTTGAYSAQYTAQYRDSKTGRAKEGLLSMHLTAGVKNGTLIRVYFLMDEGEVIVGALPKHLPTLSYR